MLVIRMQRTGRKGHAMFRMVVQDSRRTPTSGKVVAWLGSYDPHQKALQINKEKVQFYLDHGAQPSQRAITLLKTDGVNMPKWISTAKPKQRTVRNADKRKSTRPEEPKEEVTAETSETPVPTEPSDTKEETVVAEVPATIEESEAPETAEAKVIEDQAKDDKKDQALNEEKPEEKDEK